MIIRRFLRGTAAQRKAIKHFILQKQIAMRLIANLEDRSAGRFHTMFQFFAMPTKHQLVQFRHALSILANLDFGTGIENRQAGIDVPFVAIDAQRHVDLDVFNAAYVSRGFPGKLIVGAPRSAHAEKCGVRDGLRVGGNHVVLFCAQIDEFRLEAGQRVLDEGDRGRRTAAVINYHQWLADGRHIGSVQRVAAYDVHVAG